MLSYYVIFFIIILLFIVIIIQEYILINKIINPKMHKNHNNDPMLPPLTQSILPPPRLLPVDPVKDYDIRKTFDPFENPTYRPEKYIIENMGLHKYINIPTQGYPDNYHIIGTLVNDDTSDTHNKVLKLFGRQKYPKSNEWEYYTMINMGNDSIKVDLNNKREVYDHDKFKVEELNKEYDVKLYPREKLMYNPFII